MATVSIPPNHSDVRVPSQSCTALALRPVTSMSRPRTRSTKLVAKVMWRRALARKKGDLIEAQGAHACRPERIVDQGPAVVLHGDHDGGPTICYSEAPLTAKTRWSRPCTCRPEARCQPKSSQI